MCVSHMSAEQETALGALEEEYAHFEIDAYSTRSILAMPMLHYRIVLQLRSMLKTQAEAAASEIAAKDAEIARLKTVMGVVAVGIDDVRTEIKRMRDAA